MDDVPRTSRGVLEARQFGFQLPLGERSRVATSLYSQQKYARQASEKLKTSGMICTKYTGTTLAITNAAERIADGHGPARACRNR